MSSDPGVPQTSAAPSKEERNWAMAAHLCGVLWLLGSSSLIFFPFGGLALVTILGPLIIWKSKGESMPFVASQAKEALNFQITVLLLGVVGAMLIPFFLIGIPVLWVLGLVTLILVIIAAIQVSDGKAYRYPFALRLIG